MTSLSDARSAIENFVITWSIDGMNNGQPIQVFYGAGHYARVTFGYDSKWSSIVDHCGLLFDDAETAIADAEKRIRSNLIARLDAAERLAADLQFLTEPVL